MLIQTDVPVKLTVRMMIIRLPDGSVVFVDYIHESDLVKAPCSVSFTSLRRLVNKGSFYHWQNQAKGTKVVLEIIKTFQKSAKGALQKNWPRRKLV